MGIKISELNSGISISDDDLFPLSQDIGSSQRKTLKATALQIKNSFNQEVLSDINSLSAVNKGNTIDKTIFNNFLLRDGSKKMNGDLYMDGSTITKYSARILTYTDNFTLSQDHNTSIILIDKPNLTGNPSNKVTVTVNQNDLNVGFNVILIQTGNTLVEVFGSVGIELWNADGLRTTRGKFSLINLCVLKPNKVWLFGDVAGVF
jgi:hypothetical protein